MKKTLIIAATLACAVGVYAQGTIVMNNRVVGSIVTHVSGPEPGNQGAAIDGNRTNDEPAGVTMYTGPLLAGTGFSAELWAGTLGTPEGSLQPIASSRTTFRTGGAAGFIVAVVPDPAIPGVPENSMATAQLRAWDNQGGTVLSWAAALIRGESLVFNTPPLGGIQTASPNMTGLRSFNLSVIPEPSVIALGLLGLGSLLMLRRRK